VTTRYCTQADLEKRIRPSELVQLANDTGGSTVDADILNEAIDDASSEIDAVAGARYSVPFSPIPDFIVKLACDLTLVALAERRGAAPKWVETRAARVRSNLKRLAAGTLTLGLQPEPARNDERAPVQTGPAPTFTADSLKGY